ncbi:RidA family protein [Sphingomonas changnyeongensis]|uniref:RidA family protein n=2 Tax=Sphingomonas changnyeongensis TaxID=2698679 RepID=A0A7Z2NXQ9_9SPHN|nr:RidA family protein [Sphingomonas changnyeongensis]
MTAVLALAAAAAAAPAQAVPPPVSHVPAYAPDGTRRPFSQSVRAGDMVYLSGQLGTRPDGTLPEGIEAQSRQMMENIAVALRAAGLGFEHVVHCLVMLDDMADWEAFNRVYVPYFPAGQLPARSAMGVEALALGARVEMECQANAAWR